MVIIQISQIQSNSGKYGIDPNQFPHCIITMTSNNAPHPTRVPGPWHLTGEIYVIVLSSSMTHRTPGAYAAMEAESDFASEENRGNSDQVLVPGGSL
ncbi:hypothetical protein M422DRAFT_255990 [Sphaerobolus stellatus SS14]|uniref:Uncharacterized protein n=1 Tax=Sphaerobolus stellatus (strain SS14) TaxID=990650 RepID=A0A0C9UDI5_SPHS4|nr:hypothetical protein M422DRAFT_255990 [Sphaerobolus stellatus SS14]